MNYSAYGLSLESDSPVPFLVPCDYREPPDVRIHLHGTVSTAPIDATERAWYVSESLDATGQPSLTIYRSAGDGSFTLCFVDGVRFVVDARGSVVCARWPRTSSLEDVAIYLAGPVLGFLLRLRGVVSLHASAVAIGDRTVAFVGSAGSGKSTAAAAFATLGFPVLTEDIAVLVEYDGGYAIRPGYPHVALWPDSASALVGAPDALPPFTPGWDKRCLDLTATDGFVRGLLPLSAIYLLSNRPGSGVPHIATPRRADAVMALLGNIYGNRLFHQELRVKELDTVRSLAAAVPVREALRSADLGALTTFCEVIVEDLSSSASPSAALVCPATPMRDVQHF